MLIEKGKVVIIPISKGVLDIIFREHFSPHLGREVGGCLLNRVGFLVMELKAVIKGTGRVDDE